MGSLSTLGLRAFSTSYTATEGLVPVPGRSTLFLAPNGPAGILLKRISSMQEAVNCGGVYFFDRGDPNKWCFHVGATLVEAIGRRRLGKRGDIAKRDSGAGSKMYDFFERRSWNGRELIQGKTQGWMTERIDVQRNVYLGGDVFARCELVDHFASNANLGVYGLVTAASEGMGFSAFGHEVTRSFMASHVPMSVPFSKYISDVKAKHIASIPEKLKGYYEATFDTVLSNYAGKDARPTIAITTVWNGKSEAQPEAWRPAVLEASGIHLSTFSDTGKPWNYLTIEAGLNGPLGNPDRIKRNVWREVGAPFDTVTTQQSKSRVRSMVRAGHYGSALGNYTDLCLFGENMPSVPMALQTGVVGKLQVGFLRDFHVLGRSLVGGERYALAEPSHATVAELITETMDDQLAVEEPEGLNEQTPVEELEAQADYAVAAGKIGSGPIYQRGTLVTHLTNFFDLWDKDARAYAKASS